jgi:S-adenosylmethionine:tRNA ribosyltransferase-isomerase
VNGAPQGVLVSDYDYVLPPGRIAAYPSERREESRLLHLNREGGGLDHLRFGDVLDLFRTGDVLVVNESRVLPARLLGRKPTGARSEILLIRPWTDGAGRFFDGSEEDRVWQALVKPGSKLKPGTEVEVADGVRIQILDSTPDGGRVVRIESAQPVSEVLDTHGHVPLPPYIEREDEALDRERYQTVYARTPGSVAAPTAGLHFTEGLLDELALRGVGIATVTLHVGVGTFRPIEVENPADHPMHTEWYRVTPTSAEIVNAARAAGGRIWAVGTTSVRTLESVARSDGRIRPGLGETRLFIRPPYRFRAVDALITNFHLPRSTLLMLVAAFAGFEETMNAYRAAIEGDYRFYSYGDAMVIT